MAQSDTECNKFGPRVDCGYVGIQEAECKTRGCCWSPFQQGIRQAWCFTQNNHASSYNVSQATSADNGAVTELLSWEQTQPELGPDIERLLFKAETGSDIVHVRLTDADTQRYEVPKWLLRPSGAQAGAEASACKLEFTYSEVPFSFAVLRNDSNGGPALFNTSGHRLVYKDQYLELSSTLPASSSLFGLGERTSSSGMRLPRTGVPVTMWNRDAPSEFADQNLYGSHPFVLELRPDGSAHGMLLLSSNGMDVVLTEEQISFRILGGILDLYIFAGPTPAQVLEQLTRVIGRPALPPFWSLGFHQCKYGYKSVWEIEEVVANYSKANIPLDVMWADIDYMAGWRDFTLDDKNFPLEEMQAFVEGLHRKNMSFVPIIDPGIKAEKGYAPYDAGIAADVFIKDVTGQPYLGQVWPGATHYPDFLNPETAKYWQSLVQDFHKQLPFDGLWIDMNEASNFCSGEVCILPSNLAGSLSVGPIVDGNAPSPTDCFLQCKKVSNSSEARLLYPPYAISNSNSLMELSFRTIPTTATHYDGSLQYNTHNLYGLSEARVTAAALEATTDKRPFVLTRSSFPGTGSYAAHWTGDNAATWNDLRWSIASVLTTGISGIPFVGADICGFISETTEELCTRWISAGAFYPFSRDHSDLFGGYQELYRWPIVAKAARKALGLRYELLTYLFSAFKRASREGTPVARALWFEFPEDAMTHSLDQQWMLGDALLISPVLQQGASSVEAYFPKGAWYNAWTSEKVEGGKKVVLDVPLGEVLAHFKGGSIIPRQQFALTAAAVRHSPFMLIVAMPDMVQVEVTANDSVVARGELFYEGEALQGTGVHLNMATIVRAGAEDGTVVADLVIQHAQQPADALECSPLQLPPLKHITLLGWPAPVSQAFVEMMPGGGSNGANYSLRKNLVAEQEESTIHFSALDVNWRCHASLKISWASQHRPSGNFVVN